MSDSIFGNPEQESAQVSNQETPEVKATPEAAQDPYADLLTTIQSDDGRQKYADVKTALESIPHAQGRIKELSEQIKEMEDRLKDQSSVDEVLKRLESTQANAETPSQELDEARLAQMLDSQLSMREKAKVQQSNQQSVVNSLVGVFGEKAEAAYIAKATEMGIDMEFMNELSRRSPTAVLAYFGINQKKASSSGSVQSSVNSAALGNAPKAERDPMDMFRSSESELVKKWRNTASKFEG